MEKLIIECFNKEEWDAVNKLFPRIDTGIPSWERVQKEYPADKSFARELINNEWCRASYYKERLDFKYEGFKIIPASEYLNKEFIPQIFN